MTRFAGIMVVLAGGLALMAQPAAAGPLQQVSALSPCSQVTNPQDPNVACGATQDVAGTPVGADCRNETPQSDYSWTTTNGCAAQVGARTFYVQRCVARHSYLGPGDTADSQECLTGTGAAILDCDTDGKHDYSSQPSVIDSTQCFVRVSGGDIALVAGCLSRSQSIYVSSESRDACTVRVRERARGGGATCGQYTIDDGFGTRSSGTGCEFRVDEVTGCEISLPKNATMPPTVLCRRG
jgi:hypothetical protein